jgi:hypothetical protein
MVGDIMWQRSDYVGQSVAARSNVVAVLSGSWTNLNHSKNVVQKCSYERSLLSQRARTI